RGEELDDLRQVALIALVQAVERYDPTRGVAFSTFATPTIVGSLKRHLRDRTWAIRPPRTLHDRALETTGLVDELTVELGRSPTVDELSARAGYSAACVREALFAGTNRHFVSVFDATDGDVDRAVAVVETGFERAEDRTLLAPLLKVLDSRRRR